MSRFCPKLLSVAATAAPMDAYAKAAARSATHIAAVITAMEPAITSANVAASICAVSSRHSETRFRLS